MKYEVTVSEQTWEIEINEENSILVNGEEIFIDFAPIAANNLFSLIVGKESFEALVEERDDVWQVMMRGFQYDVKVWDERTKRMNARVTELEADGGEVHIKAPMPGLVVKIPVEIGQEVKKGDIIIILESMKMENELKTPRDGVVERINVATGDSVDQNQVMVVVV